MNKTGFALFILLTSFSALAAERSPYGGTPAPIPGVIQAENYDQGGAGSAYHDIDAGNNGGFGRTAEDVDVDADGDQMYVGWTLAGEWLAYTVDVQVPGYYTVEARVASDGEGGMFRVAFDGVRHLDSRLHAFDTGGWRQWRLVAGDPLFLSAGRHTMFIMMDAVGSSGSVANIDWIRFIPAIAPVPGRVEAESFGQGAGVGYGDSDAVNRGGAYRNEQVDIDYFVDPTTSMPGYYVGWTEAGEWLEYRINVAADGLYAVRIRFASAGSGGTFHIEVDDIDRTGAIAVPDTGGWRIWEIMARDVGRLSAGEHWLRIRMDSNGASGSVANFDYMDFVQVSRCFPYGGAAAVIPGAIEAENFDECDAGSAYRDTDRGNAGGYYRATDVDIDRWDSAHNDHYVGWTQAGEWLEYTVKVETTGYYRVGVGVASFGHGGTFHLEVDNADKTGPMIVPNTESWHGFRSLFKHRMHLSAGQHILRLVMDSNGPSGNIGNFDQLHFVLENPAALPGTFEAEEFQDGGEGVGYHDSDPNNQGGFFRPMEGVDIDFDGSFGDNTTYVGWTQAGEWLSYQVNAIAGYYTFQAKVASQGAGGTFHLEADGVDVSGPLTVPDTGGWRAWQMLASDRFFFLSTGPHILRFVLDANGPSGSVANFDWFNFNRW